MSETYTSSSSPFKGDTFLLSGQLRVPDLKSLWDQELGWDKVMTGQEGTIGFPAQALKSSSPQPDFVMTLLKSVLQVWRRAQAEFSWPSIPIQVPGNLDLDLEEYDIEVDYRAMESLARVEVRPGVNWKEAFSSVKTYSEIFNLQYELDIDEET